MAGSVVLHAQASSSSQRRVLSIDPGPSGVVQLIGLNITGGSYADGGGVRVDSGMVTLSLCTITGNTATGVGGGGVFVWGGTVTFSSCTITGNTAGWGGGVSVIGGTVRITSTSITGNTASGAQNVYVYVSGGATVCSSGTTLTGVDGPVSTCLPQPPFLPPSPPPPSPSPSPPSPSPRSLCCR